MQRPYRVVVAEVGPGDHDRAGDRIARALRDAGFEVVHGGSSRTAEPVASIAAQEDADAVVVVVAPDAPEALVQAALTELAARGLDDVLVLGGGVRTGAHRGTSPEVGLAAWLDPASDLSAAVRWVAGTLDAREAVAVE